MNQVTRYDPGCEYAGQDEMVEAADGDFVRWSDFETMQARAEAAEAKLAELEKQEPAGKWIVRHSPTEDGYDRFSFASWRGKEPKNNTELFTRPAPSVNVAELQAQALDAAAGKAGIYCRAHKTGSAAWHKWKTAVMFLVGEASALRSNGDE